MALPVDAEHAAVVLNLLNQQREASDDTFTDVLLRPKKDPQKRSLRAHKCLVGLNPTILKMLKEVSKEDGVGKGIFFVTELDVDFVTLENLLTFMYTGKCPLKQDTVIDTIKAAADYGMERLRTKAQEFLNKITQQHLAMSGHATAAPPMTQQMNQQVAIQQQGVLDPNKYPWLPPGFYHLAAKSPLVAVMEFLPACQMCAVPNDQYTFFQQQMPGHAEQCMRDCLLARRIGDVGGWKRIRNIPYQALKNESQGMHIHFQLCKEIQEGNECSYGDNCTFAQSPEELEVWNAEKRGDFMRHWVIGHLTGFDCFMYLKGIVNRYGGGFVFKNISNDPAKPKRHLLHEKTQRIRDPRNCRMEICWHESKDKGTCKLGDNCHFAHSDLELEVWILLRSTNLSAQQLVSFSDSGNVSLAKRKSTEINTELAEMDVPPLAQLVRQVHFQCSKCFATQGPRPGDKNTNYCSESAPHQAFRVVLIEGVDGQFSLVRNVFGVFKNQHLPKKFMFCQNMHEKGDCPYQNSCLFTHTIAEIAVWNYQKQRGVKDQDALYRGITEAITGQGEPHSKKPFFGQNY